MVILLVPQGVRMPPSTPVRDLEFSIKKAGPRFFEGLSSKFNVGFGLETGIDALINILILQATRRFRLYSPRC